jgi:hypothetical protein
MRQVDGEALCRTTMCPREFCCLEEATTCPCAAVGPSGAGVQVEKVSCPECPYAQKCGESDVCMCPTRSELHERYKW